MKTAAMDCTKRFREGRKKKKKRGVFRRVIPRLVQESLFNEVKFYENAPQSESEDLSPIKR